MLSLRHAYWRTCLPLGGCPAVSAYWRYFSLCQMGLYFSHRAHPERQLVCATGEPESDEVWEGEACGGLQSVGK